MNAEVPFSPHAARVNGTSVCYNGLLHVNESW